MTKPVLPHVTDRLVAQLKPRAWLIAMAACAIASPVWADTKGHSVAASAASAADNAANKASAAATSAAEKASSALAKATQSTYTGMPDAQRWERTHRITKILGTDVRNKRGEKVGDVKDIVLDSAGAISYAIVATGGFLGMGDRLHAVPWTALDTKGAKDYLIDMDKDALKKAPSFTSRDWPNFADEQWLSNNRRFYHDWADAK